MKIALVDDEIKDLEKITRVCREFGEENNLDFDLRVFSGGERFLESLDCGSVYSIVFMDVYMGGMSGVAASRRLREIDQGSILIFLTSSEEYMPEAFACHAFEYITKPFDDRRVADVLRDALKIIPPPAKYIEIHSDRKVTSVMFDEIVSAAADAHYLNIETADGKMLRCRMTLAGFLEQTNDPRFIPVNKGIVANADHIIGIEDGRCLLDNGRIIPIRVRERLKVEQTVQNYNFNKIRSRQRYGK